MPTCALILIALYPRSIRAGQPEKGCMISWETVGKLLNAKNLRELDTTAFRKDGWPLMTDEGTWIIYGLRLRDFGLLAESDRIIAPRIPVDVDSRNCLRSLVYGNGDSLTPKQKEQLTQYAFNVFFSPEILFIAARADQLDRGFRYYMMGADGEVGEAMGGCDLEIAESCPEGEIHPGDVCRKAEFKPAVKTAIHRLDRRSSAKLAEMEYFASCFRMAGIDAAHIRKPPLRYKAVYETDVTSIWGKLVRRSFYGPPGYGEDPKHDSRETFFLLKLDAPLDVTFRENDKLNEQDSGIRELQLVLDEKDYAQFRPYINRTIKVRGKLFQALTGHHHTKVLMESVVLANHP